MAVIEALRRAVVAGASMFGGTADALPVGFFEHPPAVVAQAPSWCLPNGVGPGESVALEMSSWAPVVVDADGNVVDTSERRACFDGDHVVVYKHYLKPGVTDVPMWVVAFSPENEVVWEGRPKFRDVNPKRSPTRPR